MLIHIKIIGYILIGLSLIHIGFPRYFNWKEQLEKLSLINRQMMKVHTFFIALVVLLMGLLCILRANDLMNTKLGNTVCLGMALFWLIRLYFQLFFYSPKLWRGRRFETAIHIGFSFCWTYFSCIFTLVSIFNFK